MTTIKICVFGHGEYAADAPDSPCPACEEGEPKMRPSAATPALLDQGFCECSEETVICFFCYVRTNPLDLVSRTALIGRVRQLQGTTTAFEDGGVPIDLAYAHHDGLHHITAIWYPNWRHINDGWHIHTIALAWVVDGVTRGTLMGEQPDRQNMGTWRFELATGGLLWLPVRLNGWHAQIIVESLWDRVQEVKG